MSLEYWKGDDWGQIDFGIGQSWNLEGFSGGSWQHWPAKYQTVWLLRNGDEVWDSWEVDEFGFYDTTGCEENPMTGEVIVSGYRGDHNGLLAMDGIIRTDHKVTHDGTMMRNLDNYWMSGCGPCAAGEAYIGLDFGWERKQVKCFRVVQSPRRGAQSPTIDLVYWDGESWALKDRFKDVGGGSWNRRPSPANTLWRIRYENRRPAENDCDGRRQRQYERSWGVSEIGFFFDERCKEKIKLFNGGREEGDMNSVIGNRGRNLK
jgi:hypothetical protein